MAGQQCLLTKMRRVYRYWSSCLVVIICITGVSISLGQENLPALIKRTEPSIVVILTYNKEGMLLGQGTGFFINKEGDVITNFHVLQGASRADIKMSDGRIYSVKKVLAEDQIGDLVRASVDIPEGTVRPLSVSMSPPEVGERVVVIGTPLGLEKTVSDGIVSAVRDIPEFGKIVQVTAPISQGSSGSPVINMNGDVVGVITFFVLLGQNLNFAIPGERISRLTPGEGQTLSKREEIRVEEGLALAERLYSIAIRYLWAEEYEKALVYFVESVKKNPRYAEAYFQIGYCKGKLGRYSEAIEPYQQAIRLKPDDMDTLNNLCVAYAMTERYNEAIESCKQAIHLMPGLAEAHNNLGWSYHKLGRYQEAMESCKQAIRLKPDFALAHYNLGNNYAALKRYEEAIEAFKQAIRIKFDYPEGHLNLGAAYNQVGRYEEAIESYKQAVRIKPDFAEAHLDLGMIYLRMGDRDSALGEYKILRDLDKELANKLFDLIYE
jgi:tetratricopeptide (TPR) repeat protein